MNSVLDSIINIYRKEYLRLINEIKDDSIKVVEFYVSGQQFFVDRENNIYVKSTNGNKNYGSKVGYLKDKTIYLGSLQSTKAKD